MTRREFLAGTAAPIALLGRVNTWGADQPRSGSGFEAEPSDTKRRAAMPQTQAFQ
jgi:hypothetical protein